MSVTLQLSSGVATRSALAPLAWHLRKRIQGMQLTQPGRRNRIYHRLDALYDRHPTTGHRRHRQP